MSSIAASEAASGTAPAFAFDAESGLMRVSGDWTVWRIGVLADEILAEATPQKGRVKADLSELGEIDTAGAMAFDRILRRFGAEDFQTEKGDDSLLRQLLEMSRRAPSSTSARTKPRWTIERALEKIGRAGVGFRDEAVDTLAFVGEALTVSTRVVTRPDKFRWPSTFHIMETAGVDALPILTTLSFFVGLVIAYMGVNLLENFGAQVFTVELLAVAVLREFGVFITAILIAGRTDSAFAAELGAMKLNSEVDAIKTMGLDPMEVLVGPRVIALLVMTPLLTFAAMISGLAGGILVLWTSLDMSPAMTLARIHEVIPIQHFWVGMSKAPVFGLILAVIGCRQGLAVERDVQSLGARTTAAVVQSIFLIVVVDAIFAIAYLKLDI
jgi:phospholipid/cholesterol/gamma-HCH transport system permease protein